MKILLFGATGMVGHGVLRECLRDETVTAVLAISRSATGLTDPKLTELVQPDVTALPADLADYDACFFCLGVSSVGMSEADYTRITYDLTLSIATNLSAQRPGMTFVYVTGQGTDSTEAGRSMWARVKGRTENALLALPLDAFMFRPGYIQPVDGVRSKTTLYRVAYVIARPLYPVLKALFPNGVTTTANLGRAMLAVAAHGSPTRVLGNREINSA